MDLKEKAWVWGREGGRALGLNSYDSGLEKVDTSCAYDNETSSSEKCG
jgi:hypothetical protein